MSHLEKEKKIQQMKEKKKLQTGKRSSSMYQKENCKAGITYSMLIKN